MRRDQPLPKIWLLSDERNDAALERVLANLPEASGFVFRHYHLDEISRRARYDELAMLCRKLGHLLVLAGNADWPTDGVYGAPEALGTRTDRLRLATAHDADEIALANRAKADGIFLSPVFQTRSHPGGAALGVQKFQELAALAECPVIALGGMDAQRAAELEWPRWGAIDGHLR